MTDAAAFRAQFPVLRTLSYLNAGTEGPLPQAAVDAVHARIDLEALGGRCGPVYFEALKSQAEGLRAAYASVIGAGIDEMALTGSTTDGVNTVIGGFDLKPGDEVLTSDEEHPGLLAPLARARLRHGISVRVAPFSDLASAVSPATRLIACSHVSWVSGRVMDVASLVATGVPVLLDAAQSIGAVPVDVKALGCAFYAASGQKWLCGPEGSGCLYVDPAHLDDLLVPWPGYGSLAEPAQALDSDFAPGAARFDHGFPAGMRSAWALASLGVLADAGWDWVHTRAADLAEGLASDLAARGLTVGPRDRSTLVAWTVDDVDAEVARFGDAGIVIRSIPAFSMIRASVGAWSSEEELARLADVAAGG